MRTRRAAAFSLTVLAAAGPVVGQDSPLSIHGLGMPGRFESARARASGGAFAPFDQLSALTDASMAGVARLTATAAGANTYLNDDFNGVSGSRRTARFPLFQVMGSLGHGIVLGGGFTTYLDRSYKVTITDTIPLGGSGQAVTDDLASDGGVTDVRLAVARRWGALVARRRLPFARRGRPACSPCAPSATRRPIAGSPNRTRSPIVAWGTRPARCWGSTRAWRWPGSGAPIHG